MMLPRLIRASVCAVCFLILASGPGTSGWKWEQPPNKVEPLSGRRSNIFYAGEPVKFALRGDAAIRYEVRNYYGNIVDRGAATETLTLNIAEPGWYKLYLFGAEAVEPWGDSVGGTMFAVIRDDPHFPRLPPLGEPSGQPAQDSPTRSILGMGPQRHAAQNAGKPDETIADIEKGIEMEAKYYLPYDKSRRRALLVAFPNGTEDLEGVRKIVERFKDVVKYWECRNEPNFRYKGDKFVEKELKTFYEVVKSVDPGLKVVAPNPVTINPYGLAFIEDFLKAGGAKYIDAFSFHAYNNVNGDVWLARASLDGLNELLAKYGAERIEKWQTENGYFAAVYGSYQPRLQGRWTMVRFMMYEQYGIPKEHDHYWYDKSHGFWDMPTWWENDDGGVNPAAPLMRVWSEELYGTRFVRAFDFGPSGNDIYVGSLFEGSGKMVAAFMSAGATDGEVDLLVKGGNRLKVVSPFGVTSTIAVINGKATLPVAELPVYVELAKGQRIEVVPMDYGMNMAREEGTVCSHSTAGTDDIRKVNSGELENWYYLQGESPGPWTSPKDTVYPAWVEMEFPAAREISRVHVFAAPPWQGMGTLVNYELQYEKAGQWVTLDRVREPTRTFKVYTPPVRCTVDSFFSDRWIFMHKFEPITTQRIRLLIHRVTNGGGATPDVIEAGGQAGDQRITLREIEVYGASDH
ncbi:MAG: hypothetical protein KBC96_09545 [Armatimonadetes bacterium]|nr:hypothetical protein [Armatimonadota bacterium]